MRTLHLLHNLKIRHISQLGRFAHSPNVHVSAKSVDLAHASHDFGGHDARRPRRPRGDMRHDNVKNSFSERRVLIARSSSFVDLRQTPVEIDDGDDRAGRRLTLLHDVQVPVHPLAHVERCAQPQLRHEILVRGDIHVYVVEESGVGIALCGRFRGGPGGTHVVAVDGWVVA